MLNTAEWSQLWIPPEHLPLSTWAEKNLQLSSEYARRRGGLTLYGWQRDIFDSFTDPRVSEIVLMCGTQLVKTLFIQAAVAYVICEAPGPILILQPSEGDAKAFSKERLSPMLRDCPVLQGKISAAKSRDASNTIQEKWFPGGMLAIDGAISPANVARRSIRYFFTDEIDKKGYNPGVEGDVIALGDERVATYESLGKKIRTCSPTVFGRSRIGKAYHATDRRKPWVKCIGCGHYQLLTWSQVCFDPVGYKCVHCGDLWGDIERWESCDKHVEWRNESPFFGRAGFWISHLYSPWKTMAQMVSKYLEVHKNPPDHQVFVNTTLAELWQEQGETPDHEILLGRREPYPCNENAVVPERGLFLTCAVDVQENPPRLEYEVVAWGRDRENWSIAYGAIQVQAENGQPLPVTSEELWDKLNDDVLQRYFPHANGTQLPIMVMVIDTGTRPQPVYAFAVKHARPSYFAAGLRVHTPRTVVPIKGNEDDLRILSGISREDAARKRQNIRIVSIGTHCVKQELYDLLRDVGPSEDGSPVPRCHHFPLEYGKDYFEGLCAEIRIVKANGEIEWKRKPNVRNEPLDLKVYNRGAATIFGIDRFGRKQWQRFAEWVAPNRALSTPAPPQDSV
ncbi:MAG: terminase gpA endonuclease subunit, partial [Acidobacteriota bacterium]